MSKIDHYLGHFGNLVTVKIGPKAGKAIAAFDDALLADLEQCEGLHDDESPFDFGGVALTTRQDDELAFYKTLRDRRLAEVAEF